MLPVFSTTHLLPHKVCGYANGIKQMSVKIWRGGWSHPLHLYMNWQYIYIRTKFFVKLWKGFVCQIHWYTLYILIYKYKCSVSADWFSWGQWNSQAGHHQNQHPENQKERLGSGLESLLILIFLQNVVIFCIGCSIYAWFVIEWC